MTIAPNLWKLAEIIAVDIVNLGRMSQGHAREHYGPTIVNKAASMGVLMTTDHLDHLLRLCLGKEVQIEPLIRRSMITTSDPVIAMSGWNTGMRRIEAPNDPRSV